MNWEKWISENRWHRNGETLKGKRSRGEEEDERRMGGGEERRGGERKMS